MPSSQVGTVLWQQWLEICPVSPSPHSLSYNTAFLGASHKSPTGLIILQPKE